MQPRVLGGFAILALLVWGFAREGAAITTRSSDPEPAPTLAARGMPPAAAEVPPPQRERPGVVLEVVSSEHGLPIAGARVLAPGTSGRTLDSRTVVLAVSDDRGVATWFRDGVTGDRCVVTARGHVPCAIGIGAPRQRVALASERPFTVRCLDEQGQPVPDCRVMVGRAPFTPWPGPGREPGLADPGAGNQGLVVARADHNGRAVIEGCQDAAVWVKVSHPSMLVLDARAVGNESVPVESGELVITLVDAYGVVARVPSGTPVAHWVFAQPGRRPTIDPLVGPSLPALATQLQAAFPGCGVHVVPPAAVGRERAVEVHATTTDGGLWTGRGELRPIRAIDGELMLEPMQAPSGWVRVDLTCGRTTMNGVPISFCRAGDDEVWSGSTGSALQLPVGAYTVSPTLPCGELEDALLGLTFEVLEGGRLQARQVAADVPTPYGRVLVQLQTTDGEPQCAAEMRCDLGDYGSLTFLSLSPSAGAMPFYLPAGNHELVFSAVGYQGTTVPVAVRAGGDAHVEAVLALGSPARH